MLHHILTKTIRANTRPESRLSQSIDHLSKITGGLRFSLENFAMNELQKYSLAKKIHMLEEYPADLLIILGAIDEG